MASLDTPSQVESLENITVSKALCGRHYTALRCKDDSLFIFGMSSIVKQPAAQLDRDSFLFVCPYSDCLIFNKQGAIHRIRPDGQQS